MEQIRDDCLYFAQEQDCEILSCKSLGGGAASTKKY